VQLKVIERTRTKIYLSDNLCDASFNLCSSSSLAVHDDQVDTFQELVVEF
jgi:hypothetical protein